MERFRDFNRRAWQRFRALPMWAQIVIAVVVVSVIVGPFLDNGDKDKKSTATAAPPTTTTPKRESTIAVSPTSVPITVAPTTRAPATVPRRTSAPTTTTLSLQARAAKSNDGTLLVNKADFGDDWPLRVPDGLLGCRDAVSDGVGYVVFGSGDTVYAINGLARGRAAESGWHEVDEIWAADPDIGGAKKNISPLVELGLMLCRG